MIPRHRARLWLQKLEERRTPATFTVNSIADSGPDTLRQAIIDSNAAAGADIINFNGATFSTPQTISLLNVLPSISDDLTILGAGSKLLTVTRDAGAAQFRVFAIKNLGATLTVAMSGLKITNGYCDATSQTDNGGGIYVGGNQTLTLDSVEITGNTSTGQGGGIGVDQRGRLTVVNSTVSGNHALGLEYGSPNVSGFSGVGGGIYFTLDGSLTLHNTTVDNNLAKFTGAGIFLYGESQGTALIRNSTISSNTVTNTWTGGFYHSGGGGITVFNVTLVGGNGLFDLKLQNSTVTGNKTQSGTTDGGGIQIDSLQPNRITTRIESSIVSGNFATNGTDIYAPTGFNAQKVTIDYSAIGSTSGFALTTGPGGNNQLNQAFALGALAYNPSTASTRTHMPPAGSPLIDKGSNPGASAFDQRFLTRYYDDPGVSGSLTVDVGAAEVQPAGLPTAVATAPTITAPGNGLQTITVTFKDDTGLNAGTIGVGTDIQVTGPAGYSKSGTFVSSTGSGTNIVATYTVPAPTGGWSGSTAGLYTISMLANQVSDIGGQWVPAGAIGSFQAAVPRTIIVNTVNDSVSATDGKTSLREAITLANDVYPSNDSITFDPNVFFGGDIITWSALGQMFITDSVTIVGTGQTKLTFDGASASRHFNLDGPGKLSVTISGVTMSGGRTSLKLQSERGGSIYNNGEDLVLDNVWMISNTALQSYGGAIHIQGQGSLTFTNGRLNNNNSQNFAGGAISALDSGHAISISNSRLTGNNGGYYGGAIFSSGGGSVSLDRCTVNNNSTSLVLADNQGGTVLTGGGGGIMVANGKVINGAVVEDYPSISTLTVTDCLFDNNSTAVGGGGILFNGNTTGVLIRNSTFVNNKTGSSPDNVGGGMLVGNLQSNPVLIDNCTFASNSAYSGGGLFVENDNIDSVKMKSSIFALNSSIDPSQLPPDIDGNVEANNCFFGVSEGIGLQGSSSDNYGMGGLTSPQDPMLDFLQDNGGPTLTMALLPGSPCLNVGSNVHNLLNDQRGPGYARVSGAKPDIGAYELQVAAPAPTVTDVKIDDGSIQRSMIRSVTITFSDSVTFSGPMTNAITLTRDSAVIGNPLGLVNIIATQGPGNVVTLTFDTSGANPVSAEPSFMGAGFHSLPDGRYTLSIDGSQVTGVGSGLPMGGTFVLASDPAPAQPTNIFRFFGDVSGDGAASATDFNGTGPSGTPPNIVGFRQAFNGSDFRFDFDGDGSVAASDFVRFRQRFNGSVP